MSKYIALVEGDFVCNIPKGMTNGEVIQALFPKIHPCDHEQYISIYSQGSDDFFNHCQFDPKWWNAPYQKGGE